jgi:hypothetical protein
VLTDVVGDIPARSRGTYGTKRVTAALGIERGLTVKHKLVVSIITELGIQGLPTRRKRRPNLSRIATVSNLVDRKFTARGNK